MEWESLVYFADTSIVFRLHDVLYSCIRSLVFLGKLNVNKKMLIKKTYSKITIVVQNIFNSIKLNHILRLFVCRIKPFKQRSEF